MIVKKAKKNNEKEEEEGRELLRNNVNIRLYYN
jgi:hypothetical protein